MITGPNWSGTSRGLQELLEQRPPQRRFGSSPDDNGSQISEEKTVSSSRPSTAANGVDYTTVDYSDVYGLLEEAGVSSSCAHRFLKRTDMAIDALVHLKNTLNRL
jgi:hypothetical protein